MMKIIDLEAIRKKKEKVMITIPIIELMYGENGGLNLK